MKNESQNSVIPKQSRKIVPPRKTVSKQQKIEYDFWIHEKILAFCMIPKEYRKEPSGIPSV